MIWGRSTSEPDLDFADVKGAVSACQHLDPVADKVDEWSADSETTTHLAAG